MRFSIQTKLLAMCLMLIFLTAGGISCAYYVLTMQDKQQESRQRLQIAFDIILNDLEKRVSTYTERFNQFLKENTTILAATYAYRLDESEWGTIKFLYHHYQPVVAELQTFGSVALANRVMLYGGNKRLLVVYQNLNHQESTGAYLESDDEGAVYLQMESPDIQAEIYGRGLGANQGYYFKPNKLSPIPLPSGVPGNYAGDMPDTITMTLFKEGPQLGIRMVAPIYRRQEKIALLVGEVLYTQDMAEEYALLSKTDVNLYVENHISIGTLRAHATLAPELLAQFVACDDILTRKIALTPLSFQLDNHEYYQGRCALKNTQGEIVGAVTASLSKEIEQQAIRKILIAVVSIAGLASASAFGLSILFSRRTIHSIQNIVAVIGTAAAGDLRKTAAVLTRDELGMLAGNLNQMITQLRSISGQVQQASLGVKTSADAILHQMGGLIQDMQQQSASVDTTALSIEKIQTFITAVAQNTATLLASATQILATMQEMQASIGEITNSTEFLSTNLHLISSSVDHVNQTVKQITDSTGQLEEVVRHTETEIQHINHSLHNVSLNADDTQNMAKETMNAARHGQTSVEASMQGMLELKAMVGNTAQIIQEINTWGQQVSSILSIVDEITSQTALLALNAAIISAQAGSHGRGFAVVADEIKELADRTKTSTQQIGSLVHALQKKTAEGVKHIQEGLLKTDQEMVLATAVKDALTSILDHATHSSERAADTAQVIQQTVASSQVINLEMNKVTVMVSSIRTALQDEYQNLQQVATAVENISSTAEQVNHASAEQKRAVAEIGHSMADVTERFSDMSNQTETLQTDAHQIVAAMHTIRTITEQSFQHATTISNDLVKSLVSQSDNLQDIVKIFKVT